MYLGKCDEEEYLASLEFVPSTVTAESQQKEWQVQQLILQSPTGENVEIKEYKFVGSGKCVWGVGNADLGPIDYLRTENAGLVSTNKEEINNSLYKLINNRDIIRVYAYNAYRCGVEKHDKDMIINKLYNALSEGGVKCCILICCMYSSSNNQAMRLPLSVSHTA